MLELKKKRNLKKNKRAVVEPVNFVIAMIILIYALMFGMDLLRIGLQMQSISRLNTECARIVAAQGGIGGSAPRGYPGGADNYVTSSKFNQEADKTTKRVKIEKNFKADYPQSVEYRKTFETTMSFTYSWDMVNIVLPVKIRDGTFASTRTGVSEYKHNYDDWTGE